MKKCGPGEASVCIWLLAANTEKSGGFTEKGLDKLDDLATLGPHSCRATIGAPKSTGTEPEPAGLLQCGTQALEHETPRILQAARLQGPQPAWWWRPGPHRATLASWQEHPALLPKALAGQL